MDHRKRELFVAGGGLFVLGAYAAITGRFGRIETNMDVLLVAAGLGTVSAVTGCAWDSAILRMILAAVGGGILGILVSSGAWFEVLGAFFSGILLATGGRYTLERWLPDSSSKSIPSR